MEVKILQGMNPLDAAIATAGSVEDIFALAALNGIGITDDLVPGTVLQGTGLTYQAASVITNSQVVTNLVKVLAGQCLFDIAMQQLGSIEPVFALAGLNGNSITDDLLAGSKVNYSLTPYSQKVLKIYQDNQYKPASGLTVPGQPKPIMLEGIDYWGIEYDFVVQ